MPLPSRAPPYVCARGRSAVSSLRSELELQPAVRLHRASYNLYHYNNYYCARVRGLRVCVYARVSVCVCVREWARARASVLMRTQGRVHTHLQAHTHTPAGA